MLNPAILPLQIVQEGGIMHAATSHAILAAISLITATASAWPHSALAIGTQEGSGSYHIPTSYTRGQEIGDAPWMIQGDIDILDGTTAEGLLYEDYRLTLRAQQRLRISVTSVQVDPLLRVLESDGSQILVEDDDGGRGTNARLVFTPPATGLYTIRVVSGFRGLRGPYILTVEPTEDLPPLRAIDEVEASQTSWAVIGGSLTADDPALEGRHFQDYSISMNQSEDVLIRLDSADFDPVVEIFESSDRESGFIVADDDSGPGQDSLLLFRATRRSDYVIRVTTFEPDELGTYTLRVGR